MSKIAIITDSNSGITLDEAQKIGVKIIPMPFQINGKDYLEEVNLSQEQFYELLRQNADISTSQPAIGYITSLWEETLKEYDQIVHIPMSSSLSMSCETAMMLAKDFNNRVAVVDNQRISITQRHSVLDALSLAENGYDAWEIKSILEKEKLESSIYITVDTLKYLKKGGRVTPAGAAIGDFLQIKPVLQIQGGKLDAYAKAIGYKKAKRIMLEAMKKDFDTRFHATPETFSLELAYTGDKTLINNFIAEVHSVFPGYPLLIHPLPLSISCHIGPGALAIACSHRVQLEKKKM